MLAVEFETVDIWQGSLAIWRPRCPVSEIVCVGCVVSASQPYVSTGTLYLGPGQCSLLPCGASRIEKLRLWSRLVGRHGQDTFAHISDDQRISILDRLCSYNEAVFSSVAQAIMRDFRKGSLPVYPTGYKWSQCRASN